MISAVIFDMDGVITNTLRIHTTAESRLLANYNIHLSPEEIEKRYNAIPDPVMFKELFAATGRVPDLEKLAQEKYELFKEFAENNIEPIPGVLEFIALLDSFNIPFSLATSSPAETTELILNSLKIKDLFRAIITPELVTEGSLKTKMFLLAAEHMGHIPANNVVFEDAAIGIYAAKMAGMKAVGVSSSQPKEDLSGADKIIESFTGIDLNIIRNL